MYDVQYEEALRHKDRRISDLLHKADAVDKAEHQRVVAAHATVQGHVESLEADLARLRSENARMQADRERLLALADKAASLQATIDSLEVRLPFLPDKGFVAYTCSYYVALFCCVPLCKPTRMRELQYSLSNSQGS